MLNHLAFALTVLVQTPPPQDARQVLHMAAAKLEQRLATVDNYTVVQTVNGMPAPLYFEKIQINGRTTVRMVPISEWTNPDSVDTKALMTGMAAGYRMLAEGYRTPEAAGGPPPSPMNGMVAGMLDSMALFADYSAAASDSISDGRAEAAADLEAGALLATRARLLGEEPLHGRSAYLIRATGLSDIQIEQESGGGVFTLDSISMWMDSAELVPLRISMDGKMTADGRTVPITIEQESLDYQAFGPLYEPQRQVMRITGLMEAMTADPRQRREMERVRRELPRMRAEMAKMEEELAKLPAAQRRMIEGRMNQSMAQLEQMMGDGVIEMEVQRTVRDWNKGPPLDWRFEITPPSRRQ
ncbi:MAG: hypothetical protein ABR602_06205 [Gemmatimonadales bacterium]